MSKWKCRKSPNSIRNFFFSFLMVAVKFKITQWDGKDAMRWNINYCLLQSQTSKWRAKTCLSYFALLRNRKMWRASRRPEVVDERKKTFAPYVWTDTSILVDCVYIVVESKAKQNLTSISSQINLTSIS